MADIPTRLPSGAISFECQAAVDGVNGVRRLRAKLRLSQELEASVQTIVPQLDRQRPHCPIASIP